MKNKEEVLYDFAKRRYDLNTKLMEERRNRCLTFFSIITTIITAFSAFVFNKGLTSFSNVEIIFLSLALSFFILALFFFILALIPWTRYEADAKDFYKNTCQRSCLIKCKNENSNLSDKEIERKAYLETLKVASNDYILDSNDIRKTINKINNFYITMIVFLTLSLVFMIISSLV